METGGGMTQLRRYSHAATGGLRVLVARARVLFRFGLLHPDQAQPLSPEAREAVVSALAGALVAAYRARLSPCIADHFPVE